MLNDLRNPWFVSLLEGLTTTLDAVGMAPVLADSHLDRRVGRDTVETLLSQRVDGLVVVGTTDLGDTIERAAAIVPVVVAGTHEPNLPTVDIAADDDSSALGWPPGTCSISGTAASATWQAPGIVGSLRRKGFLDTMAAAGRADDALVEVSGMTEEGGYAAAARLLDRPNASDGDLRLQRRQLRGRAVGGGRSGPGGAPRISRWWATTTRISRASGTCR